MVQGSVNTSAGLDRKAFDIESIRQDFPILSREINGKNLVYLDNAATTHKPQQVIDSMEDFYFRSNANIHRAVHTLSVEGTDLYEDARKKVASFIKANSKEEVVFTSGTTESLNLIAYSWGRKYLTSADEIILTDMEHHANIVPWQMLSEEIGFSIKIIPVIDDGELDIDAYKNLLSEKTKLVSVVHVSNSLGTVNDVLEITKLAKSYGATVIVDGAQSIQHFEIDVREIGCDFFVFSGHKLYGPTGIGVLWGREEVLENMPPFLGGGDMIKKVSWEKTTYNELPYKFEAGTPKIAQAIGLGASIDYVNSIGLDQISEYENTVHSYFGQKLEAIDGLKMIGDARDKVSVHSFVIEGAHSNDIGTMLDLRGIAVRTGHHCTMPIMQRFGVEGTTRASISFYNTTDEADYLAESIEKVLRILR
ncbi:MAG: cysteine desulfurase [Candidatus Kapaibacteriales bacterium]